MAVISYDTPEIMAAFSKQRGVTFPLLSDAGSETIKRYGILNTVAMESVGPNGKDPALADDIKTYVSTVGVNQRMAGMAFPGTFILDRSGRVTSRFFEDFYVTRSTSSSILVRAGAGSFTPGTKISTAHLDVSTYPSDSAIAPGNRITLAFDVTPHRGLHVYAPGASGYRVVAVRLESEPFVKLLPARYPASRIYFFKPLNERVPTYQKPFTLVQEVELDGQLSTRNALKDQTSFTFGGALNYQACDDRLCYNPVSLPLSWTIGLKPLLTPAPRPATK